MKRIQRPKINTTDAKWSDELQCYLRSVAYEASFGEVILFLEGCPSMCGAIKYVGDRFPEVDTIAVLWGSLPEVVYYVDDDGEWTSRDLRHLTEIDFGTLRPENGPQSGWNH